MLILPAEADEAMVGTAIERIDKVISPTGGTMGSLDRWGRKRFAYEIDRQQRGVLRGGAVLRGALGPA